MVRLVDRKLGQADWQEIPLDVSDDMSLNMTVRVHSCVRECVRVGGRASHAHHVPADMHACVRACL
jgi:hypothetical protein